MMFIKTAIARIGYILLSLAPAMGSLSLRESEMERGYVCSLRSLLPPSSGRLGHKERP